MENGLVPDGSSNPWLAKYKFKRELDGNYIRLIDIKFPGKDVCYFCLTGPPIIDKMACTEFCKMQIDLRYGHRQIRKIILQRDKNTCQLCGVNEQDLQKALTILKKVSLKAWKAKRQELKIPDKRLTTLMDVDHILPISRGGGAGMLGDMGTNLQCVCLFCHYHKDAHINATNLKPSKYKTKNRKVL